jgi:HlyD family secretion protein
LPCRFDCQRRTAIDEALTFTKSRGISKLDEKDDTDEEFSIGMATNITTPRCGSHGISTLTVLGLIAFLAIVAVSYLVVAGGSGQDTRRVTGDHFVAQVGSFDITIPTSGELVAQNQIEIRNRLETRAVITEIVDEGTFVNKGDIVLQLNDEELRNRIKDAEDALNSAESALISAEANLAIRRSSAASELDRAELNVELSRLALEAWKEGEVVARRQQLSLALERAQVNFERLETRLVQSRKLYEQEFISFDELERDRIQHIEARASLQQAHMDLEVFEKYTYQQQKAQKISDVDQAVAELERVQQRHEAEIQTATADLTSRRHQLESRRERLAELERQLEYTTVKAPADGLVVYSSSMESHRWRGEPPQVGSELSRNQLVMVLPDTSRLVAAVKINEALSGLIRPGQQAVITSDAMPDRSLKGRVQSIGVLAETGGWRDPNRRDYTVRILIDEADIEGLRPSMRARAEILIDSVENVLHVPIQSIFREGGQAYAYTPVRGGYEARPVRIGRSSELYAEILDGLESGELVLLRRPSSSEIVRDIVPAPDSNGVADPMLPEIGSGEQPQTGQIREEPQQQSGPQQPREGGERRSGGGGGRPAGGRPQ